MDTLFEKELKVLINIHSKESDSNTPDFILAEFLHSCLTAYSAAVCRRDVHEGRVTEPLKPEQPVVLDVDLYGRKISDRHGRVEIGESAKHFYDVVSKGPTETILMPVARVKGHSLNCKIDLTVNWTPCTCGKG